MNLEIDSYYKKNCICLVGMWPNQGVDFKNPFTLYAKLLYAPHQTFTPKKASQMFSVERKWLCAQLLAL